MWKQVPNETDMYDPKLLTQRSFAKGDGTRPRICLRIYDWSEYEDLSGVRVSCAYRGDIDDSYWYIDSSFPLELVPHLIELLQEAQEKLNSKVR